MSAWRRILQQLRDERGILEELSAHRQGRDSLITQYQELQKTLATEKRRAQEFQNETIDCTAKIEGLRAELTESGSQYTALSEEFEDGKAKNRVLGQQVKEAQAQIDSLRRELRACQERVSGVQSRLSEVEKNSEEAAERLETAEERNVGLRERVTNFQQQVVQAQVKLDERDGLMTGMVAQLADAERCIADLQRDLDAYYSDDRENQIAPGASREFEELKKTVERLTMKLERQEEERAMMRHGVRPLAAAAQMQVQPPPPAPAVLRGASGQIPTSPKVPALGLGGSKSTGMLGVGGA